MFCFSKIVLVAQDTIKQYSISEVEVKVVKESYSIGNSIQKFDTTLIESYFWNLKTRVYMKHIYPTL